MRRILRRLLGYQRERDQVDDKADDVEQKAVDALNRAEQGRELLTNRLRAVDAYIPAPRKHR